MWFRHRSRGEIGYDLWISLMVLKISSSPSSSDGAMGYTMFLFILRGTFERFGNRRLREIHAESVHVEPVQETCEALVEP